MIQALESNINVKRGSRLLRNLSMFSVAFLVCILATASSSWLSSEKVFAIGGVPVFTNAVTKQDIEDAKKKRDNALAEAEQASDMIDQLNDRKDQLSGELDRLNAANEEQRAQYELIYGQLEAALEEKAKALDEFIVAQENLETQQKLFRDRVTVMFEYQNKSTLEVLLESDSLAGFFTNMELISLIADADAQAVDILRIAMDDAELQAEIKLKHAEEMQAIADEKQRQLDELTSLIGTTQETLDNVNTSIDSWTAREDELAAYAEDLNDEIKRLQEQYDREHGSASKNTGGASFRWPTYCRWISSPYGWRMHPTQGVEKFHYGIDIGAGYGETIMAAASGTVIFVTEPYEGCNKGGSGYGNYCVIDHGNGYTTLYGHARDLYVYEGQYVNAGDSIGEVGSTGDSSGAHLHFEVRLWGETKDPEDYLP